MNIPKRRKLYQGYVSIELDTSPDREVIVASDTIAVLMFDLKSDKVILVRQPRAPMKGITNEKGEIDELTAGRFDYDVGIVELAINEASEETTITITKDQVEIINNGDPLALSPGILTERMYMAAVEMDLSSVQADSKIRGAAGEGEKITRLVYSTAEFFSMKHQDMKSWAFSQFLQLKILQRRLNFQQIEK